MKTSPSNSFDESPQSAAAPANAPAETERTIPANSEPALAADAERTIPASVPHDPQALQAAEAHVAAEWQVGDVILDLYEVRQLHEGGNMGMVYRVHHRGWNTDLAVKSPRRDYFQTGQQKENFSQECETWINLGLHPHIVSCHYVRALGGIPRVFAEYVEGGSLKDWIDSRKLYEGGPEPALKRMLDIAIQFAWGLHYAHEHEQKIIHQDVKPANVMLTPEGVAKVSDFGLAKARAAAGESFMAGAGQSILVSSGGMTPAYCSPEQASKEPLSRQTDIWSWGMSVLEMFAGEMFWSAGQAAAEALELHVQQMPSDPAIPPMPDGVKELLKRCFQSRPEDRPRNMAEAAEKLRGINRALTGTEYGRSEPKALKLKGDALNNRGVSMLDLGRQEEAERFFNEALQTDAHHPEATYNLGLVRWRSLKMTDGALVKQLEEVHKTHASGRADYLLGLIHIERADMESAVKILEEASRQSDAAEVKTALAQAQSQLSSSARCVRTFEGKATRVTSVSLSADRRWALSGSLDKTLRLWEVATGRCVRIFEGHTNWVQSVNLSVDGRWALSGSGEYLIESDCTLRLWEAATGRCVRTFEGHTDEVSSVHLSADGRWALSGSGDTTLRLWEVGTGRCLRTFEGHTSKVGSVTLSADGRWALSGSDDHTLRLWEVATGRCIRIFEGHASYVRSVSLRGDGRWALSGSKDNTLRLWEVATGRCVRTFEGHKGWVTSVNLSADGRWALSGSEDNTLRLWEVATGRCVRTFEGHTGSVTSVSLSADGGWALSGSSDSTLRLWEIGAALFGSKSPVRLCAVKSSEEAMKDAARFDELLAEAQVALQTNRRAHGHQVLRQARSIPGYERDVLALQVWNDLRHGCDLTGLRTAWRTRTFEGHTKPVISVTLSADGRWALSGSREENTLRLWEVATGRCVRIFEGHTNWVQSVNLSTDGHWALSGSWDNTLRLWEVPTGRCIRIFEGHASDVRSVSLSADRCCALSGSGDTTLRLWEVTTGRCLRTFEGHTDMVTSVNLSADGRWALSGSSDKTLRLWEVATGRCVRTFEGHTHCVQSVNLSADGRWALSGSSDKTLRLWEVATGRCVRTFEGHTLSVQSVNLSTDGRWVLSGSLDKALRLWEVATGRCARTFEGDAGGVRSVSLSADGRWALSGSDDHTLQLWELDWEFDEPVTSSPVPSHGGLWKAIGSLFKRKL